MYLGDNLEVLRGIQSESIDLIYIDPPFFSGRNYNVIWGDTNEVRTFYDVWEGGIESYLVWLNARLWEMRRVLKKTGSIYVHCDWHASHYIKTEMDKIFGYDNFRNEVVWYYTVGGIGRTALSRKHDILFWYSKSKDYFYDGKAVGDLRTNEEGTFGGYFGTDKDGRKYREVRKAGKVYKYYLDEPKNPDDVWIVDKIPERDKTERIGYPTQKPEKLIERIINATSKEGELIADFFCGGSTTLAVTLKGKRQFVGCDSSRVAISVSMDRLIKIGEKFSGVKSNLTKLSQEKLKFAKKKVPNIEIYYQGVYPVEKFEDYPEEDFIDFVLSSYGASRNTASGITHGYRPPGQQEPILVGPADPNRSIDGHDIKLFINEIKEKLEPNKLVNAKIIGWRFDRQVTKYIKILERYIDKNNLPLKIELISLDSREFRTHILRRLPNVTEADFSLRFSKPPAIGDIKVKKVKDTEYQFEAIDAFSTNEDSWLVNCQWDFDYQEGHFAADKDYILSREKSKDKNLGEIFKAKLDAQHKFEKSGEVSIACKVQDNLAGETVLSKTIKI